MSSDLIGEQILKFFQALAGGIGLGFDFYREQICYEDYYLDDEDDYLDDDEEIDNSESERDSEEEKAEPEAIDQTLKEFNTEREKADDRPAVSEEKEINVIGADTDQQQQAAGGMKRSSEVRNQKDMKTESTKSSGKKKEDSGKKEAGKRSNGQGKSGTQKSSAERTGAKRSSSTSVKGTGRGRKAKKSGISGGVIALIAAGVIIGAGVAAYIGVSTYFTSHFFMNTEINGHDFSMKTTADVKEYMQQQVQGYKLTILEKNNQSDSITGEDISLEYKESKDIENALKAQNAFMWPKSFFVKNSSETTVEVSYDRDALERLIAELQAVKAEQVPPVSAYPKYNGTEYEVEPEVTGTQVDMDMLREKVHQYISEFQTELDMDAERCYALPKYTSESGDVRAACNEMNQYLQASITYSMDQPVVVDKTLTANWVSVDENMQVTFDEGAVREWLREFGRQYDTVGKTRTITSPYGKTVEVSGGTYGWSVDEDAEYPALLASIKNGEVVTREPIYVAGQTAASRGPQDWGSTYAEVDLSAQHMWYIVDGGVALDTDVVTGVPTPDKETPSGVYSILEKELNSTLVGEIVPSTGQPEYRTVVAFWMRVTWSGIGFHDATWQPAFGGSLYANGAGSHGCINMPYDQASALYNMMPVGTPVIIHY